MLTLRLPIPPSVNGLYLNARSGGRVKTPRYRQWIIEADKWLLIQKHKLIGKTPIVGKCELSIRLPKIVGDASNRIKSVEDFLVSRKITGDDKHNMRVSVEIDPLMTTRECWIEVRAA